MVSRFACGKSSASKWTSASIRLLTNATLRASPNELGNYELGAMHATGLEGFCQLRPIRAFAALDFDEFGDDAPIATVQMVADRLLLRSQPETGPPLALSRNSEVADEICEIGRVHD